MTDITPEEAMERLRLAVLSWTHGRMSQAEARLMLDAALAASGLTPTSAASLMGGEAVVVPKNPTPQMFSAAWEALVPSGDARACWESMIAAAQQKDQG